MDDLLNSGACTCSFCEATSNIVTDPTPGEALRELQAKWNRPVAPLPPIDAPLAKEVLDLFPFRRRSRFA